MPAHHQLETDQDPAQRAPEHAEAAPEAATPKHPLLRMQRQLGNARVAHLRALQRESLEDEEELLQARHDPTLQREAVPEEEEELLQAMPEVGLEGGPVSDGLARRIDARRGGGATLDNSVRTHMESAFATNFDSVRVHSDSEAQQLSRSISAQAFTTGNDIFLGQGASPTDRSLLAHELTHVVQQRTMNQSGPMSVGPAGDRFEQEADSTARAVTSGGEAPIARQTEDE